MKDQPLQDGPYPSAQLRREAAVWIARMHSPDRAPPVEAGLRRWLKESAAHQRAFELANEVWDTASRIPDGTLPRMMRWKQVVSRPGLAWTRAAAVLGAVAIVAIATTVLWRDPALTTGIGEQRVVMLKDGTRVSLNTNTRLRVRYSDRVRQVRLDSGEALFDVAQNAATPFVVVAIGHSIEALGTSFVVRRDEGRLAVTLIEGKVNVSTPAMTPYRGGGKPDPGAVIALTPGERVTFPENASTARRDRPRLDKLTAWQRGLVALDYTLLADAAGEMNRYSDVPIVIASPEAAAARISGVFRAGESLSFAHAIARTYGLEVVREPGRIVISGAPQQTR